MKSNSLFYYRHNKNTPFFNINKRKNNFFDITLVISNEMHYIINDEVVDLKEGDIICMPQGCLCTRKESAHKTDYASFNFFSDDDYSDWKLVLHNCIDHSFLSIISLFDEEKISSSFYESEKITYLFNYFLSKINSLQKETKESIITDEIIKFLKDNIDKKITLKEIGNEFNYSPIYCESLFKKEKNQSIIDYLLDMRINEAKKLIIENILSVSDIALATGFQDYNYFSRTFKKRTGYTPTQFYKIN